MKIEELAKFNPWWINKESIKEDLHIKKLEKQKFKWTPRMDFYIKLKKERIYSLRGPRQVGKTTYIKNKIKILIEHKKINPKNIFFLNCEQLRDEKDLEESLKEYFKWSEDKKNIKYIFIDEASSLKEWAKVIKKLVDLGTLKNSSLLITGSHSIDIKKAAGILIGRRGESDESLDKILLPMKFSEYVNLKTKILKEIFSTETRKKIFKELFEKENRKVTFLLNNLKIYSEELENLFNEYLRTGGIPKVLNEYEKNKKIIKSTVTTYTNYVLRELINYSFEEEILKKVVEEIIKNETNTISWRRISSEKEIHKNTVKKYVFALEKLFVLGISYFCDVNNKKVNEKKNKKVYFQDPFFYHILKAWVNSKNINTVIEENILSNREKSIIVESIVYNHLSRLMFIFNPYDYFDTKRHIFYYRTDKGKEIDFILKWNNECLPIEVKYKEIIKRKDIPPFDKTKKRGVILTKKDFEIRENYIKIPVHIFLYII